MAVNAVFAGSAMQSTPNSKQKSTAPPSVVRVQSRTLFYSDNNHKAVFSGGVVAQTASGLLHSNFMDVYLAPAGGAKPPGKTTQSSQVSKIVARGSVDLRQPDRKGTGEELTYTADDGKFVLYSVGWNEKDDGGVPGKTLFDQTQGDWVWSYPSQLE